jgi:DNA-binding CsgD family transcriptional regulator
LTAREIDVLRLIVGGNANKEIASQLGLTEETVKHHVKDILSKLGANDRTHAVTIAQKRGIIKFIGARIPRKRDDKEGFLGCRVSPQIPYHQVGMHSATSIFKLS